jgi:hypothetical protein
MLIAYAIGYVVAIVVLFLLFRKILLWALGKFLPVEYTEPSLEEKQAELKDLHLRLKNLDQEVLVTEELVDIDEELRQLRDRLTHAEFMREEPLDQSNKGD